MLFDTQTVDPAWSRSLAELVSAPPLMMGSRVRPVLDGVPEAERKLCAYLAAVLASFGAKPGEALRNRTGAIRSEARRFGRGSIPPPPLPVSSQESIATIATSRQ